MHWLKQGNKCKFQDLEREKIMMKEKIIEAAIWRSAIKVFDTEKKISDDDFNFLLEIARYSPSSFGLEPWNLLVLQNKELREAIIPYATGAQNQLRTASHFVVFTVKKNLHPESEYFKHINMDVKGMDISAYNNFISNFSGFMENKQQVHNSREMIDWAGKQSYIALGNMMNAAALLGIDSCPIEGFFAKEVEDILDKSGQFNSNIDKIVVMGAFGYRGEEPKHKKARRSMNEVVHFVN